MGEMERDALLGHGITNFIKESYMERSDKFSMFISKSKGVFIVGNKELKMYRYNNNDVPEDDVCEIQIPYANKLALQEFLSIGFDVKFIV
jgi:DNA-directed RNA polymerase II subunit RPB2